MRTQSLIGLAVGALLLAACGGGKGDDAGPTTSADQLKEQPTATATGASGAAPVQVAETPPPAEARPDLPPHDVLYDDSIWFDSRFASELRSGKDQVVLIAENSFTVNKIPEELDKWLSRIQDEGGTVKAQAEPDPDKPKTRMALFGALLDVVLYFVGLAKEEYTYSSIDDYDAMLFFDEKTNEVTRVVLYKRN